MVMDSQSSTTSTSTGVKQVLISVLDLPLAPADLDDELSLRSDVLDMDSLTLLHLIAKLEERFDIEIDDEVMMSAKLVDVSSLTALVDGQVVRSRPAPVPSPAEAEVRR